MSHSSEALIGFLLALDSGTRRDILRRMPELAGGDDVWGAEMLAQWRQRSRDADRLDAAINALLVRCEAKARECFRSASTAALDGHVHVARGRVYDTLAGSLRDLLRDDQAPNSTKGPRRAAAIRELIGYMEVHARSTTSEEAKARFVGDWLEDLILQERAHA